MSALVRQEHRPVYLGAQPGPSTSNQREYVRNLLARLDLPTDVITLLHAQAFRDAGLPAREAGRQVDVVLGELTRAEAQSLIEVLKRMAGGLR
jgi:hypothetical protein